MSQQYNNSTLNTIAQGLLQTQDSTADYNATDFIRTTVESAIFLLVAIFFAYIVKTKRHGAVPSRLTEQLLHGFTQREHNQHIYRDPERRDKLDGERMGASVERVNLSV
jgi:hypothetical protein